MTGRIGWLALGLVVVGALAVVVGRSEPSNDPEARARRIDRELMCPVCTGQSVAESSAPEARAIRVDIRERIAAGQGDEEIVQVYVDIYGERIRTKPEGEGFGLIAWGLPVVVLIVGAAGIVIALRRWSAQPRLAATDADEALVRGARGYGDD